MFASVSHVCVCVFICLCLCMCACVRKTRAACGGLKKPETYRKRVREGNRERTNERARAHEWWLADEERETFVCLHRSC